MWLILQRLDDFKERFGDLRSELAELRTDLRRVDDKVEGMRNWFAGTLFTLVVGFGTVLATVLSRHP